MLIFIFVLNKYRNSENGVNLFVRRWLANVLLATLVVAVASVLAATRSTSSSSSFFHRPDHHRLLLLPSSFWSASRSYKNSAMLTTIQILQGNPATPGGSCSPAGLLPLKPPPPPSSSSPPSPPSSLSPSSATIIHPLCQSFAEKCHCSHNHGWVSWYIYISILQL